MEQVLEQHQIEISRNRRSWVGKPLLQRIYHSFYDRIVPLIDSSKAGKIVEIGSGIGQLKSRLPQAISTDLFPNPWLDLVCDGYELPFRDASLAHLVLFDVFHHLEAPRAFFQEAKRVLAAGGRLILFEPYISWVSSAAYGLFHHEPTGWNRRISRQTELRRPRGYYAAQGNATRLFFRREHKEFLEGWTLIHREAFASFSYLFSGGFSKPALYREQSLPLLHRLDTSLSQWPRWFGARCLVALEK